MVGVTCNARRRKKGFEKATRVKWKSTLAFAHCCCLHLLLMLSKSSSTEGYLYTSDSMEEWKKNDTVGLEVVRSSRGNFTKDIGTSRWTTQTHNIASHTIISLETGRTPFYGKQKKSLSCSYQLVYICNLVIIQVGSQLEESAAKPVMQPLLAGMQKSRQLAPSVWQCLRQSS
jgi:hypothetical protein